MKHLFLKYGWLPALLLFSACMKEPVYPDEPNISFNSITQQKKQDALGNPVVELKIAVNFKDGDGNLGLSEEDTLAPFNDTPGNKFKNNYFVKAFVSPKGQSKFQPYEPFIPYDGRFLRLSPDDGSRTLEGELRYTINILPGFDFQSGDRIKFNIQIADRSLHLSNTIETEPITLEF